VLRDLGIIVLRDLGIMLPFLRVLHWLGVSVRRYVVISRLYLSVSVSGLSSGFPRWVICRLVNGLSDRICRLVNGLSDGHVNRRSSGFPRWGI
jgi:hypothetical protein